MAKKKGNKQQKIGPPKAEFSEPSPADFFPPKVPTGEISCMEFATTPSADPSNAAAAAAAANISEFADMCSDLADAPCFVDEEDDAADALNEWAEAATSAEIVMASSCDRLEADECFESSESSEASDKLATDTSEDLPAVKPVELTITASSNKLAVMPSDCEQDAHEIQTEQGGVSDLVAQQLRQMLEDGGATATCASQGSFTGTHSMNLNVKAGAVDMNLSTVTEANQELVELRAQIELQQKLLAESQLRLDAANQRIGYLEAEIAQKNKILEEKLEQSSWLRSLFGL